MELRGYISVDPQVMHGDRLDIPTMQPGDTG